MFHGYRGALALLCATVSCLVSVAAASQNSDGAEASKPGSSDDQLQEVIVTAEKREATVQSTPISITAITGADLTAEGLTDMVSVAEQTPGLSFRTAGPGQTEFEMRGISSTGGSVGTVGFYVDETPITPPSIGAIGKVVIDPALYDLQSVEVLRGPQGTLYGSGSMGGTIRLITNQPDLTRLDASAEVSGSGTDGGGFNRSGNLMLNIPLIDDVMAIRLVASSLYRDGWLDRIVVDPFPFPSSAGCPPTIFSGCVRGNVAAGPISAIIPRVNWERLNTFRPSIRIAPSDELTITLSALYQDTHMGGYDEIDIPPGCVDGTLCGHYQPFNTPEPFSDVVRLLSGVIRYDATYASVTSATSYWTRSERQTEDASEAIENVLATPFIAIPYTETDRSEQLSEELRVTSKDAGAFQWLAGLFFSNFHFRWSQYTANENFSDPINNPEGVLLDLQAPYDTQQYAAFSEASYKITPAWKITVGLRAFRYESQLDYYAGGLFSPFGPATPLTETIRTGNHGQTPKFNLAYIPNDDLTLYATASQGFRPGGIGQGLPLTGPASCLGSLQALGLNGSSITYGPDSLWNYELGEKARLFGGKVTVHGDVFYIRWKGIQQVIPLSCGSLLEANAGDARSYGSELEVEAKVAPNTTVDINGAYTNATLDHPAAFTGFNPGQPLLNIPKYTASASLKYEYPVSNDMSLTARLSENVIGPEWDTAYQLAELPSYALTNLRLSLTTDRWSAALFVDNAGNRQAVQTINDTFFVENIPALTRATVNQPRTIGVTIGWHMH
jgi:iron complex outermembrane recepter protein